MSKFSKRAALAGLLIGLAGMLYAQAPALTRTIVTRADVSVPGREAVLTRVSISPGGAAGWHTHPGDEISYVAEGELSLMVAGQPTRKVVPGEGFVIPAGTVHNARNETAAAVNLVGVYVVEKGQPLATPASAPSP